MCPPNETEELTVVHGVELIRVGRKNVGQRVAKRAGFFNTQPFVNIFLYWLFCLSEQ